MYVIFYKDAVVLNKNCHKVAACLSTGKQVAIQ